MNKNERKKQPKKVAFQSHPKIKMQQQKFIPH